MKWRKEWNGDEKERNENDGKIFKKYEGNMRKIRGEKKKWKG